MNNIDTITNFLKCKQIVNNEKNLLQFRTGYDIIVSTKGEKPKQNKGERTMISYNEVMEMVKEMEERQERIAYEEAQKFADTKVSEEIEAAVKAGNRCVRIELYQFTMLEKRALVDILQDNGYNNFVFWSVDDKDYITINF